MPRPDVVVVGGGVIGLGVAWRLTRHGVRVEVHEAGSVVGAASRAAAAMIAPVGYVEPLDDQFLRLRVDGAARWPSFAAELAEETGADPRYQNIGSLLAATTPEELERARVLHDFHGRLGIGTESLSAAGVAAIEPRLTPDVLGGLYFPDDGCVCPEAFGQALVQAIRSGGGAVHERTPVRRVLTSGDRVVGVRTEDGTDRSAGAVVVAAGAASGRIEGLPADAVPSVRGVKGQSVYVRSEDPRFLRTVLRAGANVVPRGDGRILLAGTVEPEAGDDRRPTAGGLLEVLEKARRVVPDLADLEVVAHTVGQRPVAADDAPVLGPGRPDGLWWATGHSYYGVLLTPITADLIAGAVVGEADAVERARHFDVRRFADGSPSYTSLHTADAHR